MELIEKNALDLAVESIQDRKGYSIIEIVNGVVKIINFDNKAELNRNFGVSGGKLVPRNRLDKNEDNSYLCRIDGEQVNLNIDNLYLVVNGGVKIRNN